MKFFPSSKRLTFVANHNGRILSYIYMPVSEHESYWWANIYTNLLTSDDSSESIMGIRRRRECIRCRRCSPAPDNSATDRPCPNHIWPAFHVRPPGRSHVSTAIVFCTAHHGTDFHHKSSVFRLRSKQSEQIRYRIRMRFICHALKIPVSGPPSFARNCCNFFSRICWRRRRITASGFEMDRVNDVSGNSVYNFSATWLFSASPDGFEFNLANFSFFFCSFFSRFDSFRLKFVSTFSTSAAPFWSVLRRRKRPSRSSMCQFNCTSNGCSSAFSFRSSPLECTS